MYANAIEHGRCKLLPRAIETRHANFRERGCRFKIAALSARALEGRRRPSFLFPAARPPDRPCCAYGLSLNRCNMASTGHLDVPVIGASDDFDVVVAKLARYVSPTERLNTSNTCPRLCHGARN
jgi:hypothetical protein